MKFAIHQANHIGGRQYNQDRAGYAYTSETLLLLLADGMGGHLHGEIAAQMAIDTFLRAFSRLEAGRVQEPEVFLRASMRAAHDAIIDYARERRLGGNPGTTCVAVLVQDGKVWVAHAGDSRFYQLRDGKVIMVTHDHSVVQQWADWGIIRQEEAKSHPDRNKITNCLGGEADMFYAEVSPPAEVEDGDVLLLCSDGFWGPLEETEFLPLQNALSLPVIVGELIDRAVLREAGHADNTTVVVARLGPDEPDHPAESPVCAPLNIT